jgi:hypothetical protein
MRLAGGNRLFQNESQGGRVAVSVVGGWVTEGSPWDVGE